MSWPGWKTRGWPCAEGENVSTTFPIASKHMKEGFSPAWMMVTPAATWHRETGQGDISPGRRRFCFRHAAGDRAGGRCPVPRAPLKLQVEARKETNVDSFCKAEW
eukprot:5614068-Pyramimonas_sp.AAC.1